MNEKVRYCWLNSDKMDGSNVNGMAIKMTARINPFKAIGCHFDLEKLKKLNVDRASKINTSWFNQSLKF